MLKRGRVLPASDPQGPVRAFGWFALVASLACGIQGCSDDGAERQVSAFTDCSSSSCLSGDAVLQGTVAQLAANPEYGLGLAFERAVNEIGGFGVQPMPTSACHDDGHENPRKIQNMERLGAVAVASYMALGAKTASSTDESALSVAPMAADELPRVIDALSSSDSPAVLLSGLRALTKNAHVRDTDYRALVWFVVDVWETKRFRDPDGSLRIPDLDDPPSADALLARLAASPSRGYRVWAAGSFEMFTDALTQAQADAIVNDASYHVRAVSGKAFWSGSDKSPARQHAQVAWFSSDEAHEQMRTDTLWEDYGVRSEEAAQWSDVPNGIERRYAEARGRFIGDALAAAPPEADISVLLAQAALTSDVTSVIEDAVAAVLRSANLKGQTRIDALSALYKGAVSANFYHDQVDPLIVWWQALTPTIVDAPVTDQAMLERFEKAFGWQHSGGIADLIEALASTDRSERIKALMALATRNLAPENLGLAAGLVALDDVDGEERQSLLEMADKSYGGGFRVHDAALDAGVAPSDLAEHLRVKLVNNGSRPSDDDVRIYVKALSHPKITADDISSGVVSHITTIDPYYLQNNYSLRPLLALLDDERVTHKRRAGAWKTMLWDAQNHLRVSVALVSPLRGPSVGIVAQHVRQAAVSDASTCWQGHSDPATSRPALNEYLLTLIVGAAKQTIDPREVRDGRVSVVRDASSHGEALPEGADAQKVFDLRPGLRDEYVDFHLRTQGERDKWRQPAADVAAELLTTAGVAVGPVAKRLAFSEDYHTLPAATLDAVDLHISKQVPIQDAADQFIFFLHAMRGVGYDELHSRFRDHVDYRWDLGDAARAGGEQAAMEAILGAVGSDFGTLGSMIDLSASVVSRASVSSSYRQGLLEYAVDSERYWTTLGMWGAGTIGLVRCDEPDLGFLTRDDLMRIFGIGGASGDDAFIASSALLGTVVADRRLPAEAALELAWSRLSFGHRDRSTLNSSRVPVTEMVDAVLAAQTRSDIPQQEREALGRALLYVLE